MSQEPKSPLKFVSDGDLLVRVLNGEVFENTGWRFGEELEKYLKSLNGKPNNRKTGCFSPSGLTKCKRRLAYQRKGVEGIENTAPRFRMIMDTGKAVHTQLNGYVAGMFGVAEAVTEVEVEMPDLGIHGETDLVLFHMDSGKVRHVVDFKTIKNDSFLKLRPPFITADGTVTPKDMTAYVWQLHAYMLASDCPNSSLFYYNKNDSTWVEYEVVINKAICERIRDLLCGIDYMISQDQMPEQEVEMWCRECPYVKVCGPPGVFA